MSVSHKMIKGLSPLQSKALLLNLFHSDNDQVLLNKLPTTGGMPSSTSNGKGRIVFNLFKLNLLDIFYKDFGHRASKITQHKSDNLTHNFTNGICHIFENI